MSQSTTAGPQRSPLRPSLDWLLVFVPVCFAMRFVEAWKNDTLLFVFACLAIIPLAGWLGRATEHLAEHVGEGLGGLLNATFGNAAELIIALMALHKGLTDVVKASLTGSIIGNLLLVLGVSLLAGGLKHPQQRFNQTAARASAASLTMAAVGLLIPSLYHQVADRQVGGWSLAKEQQLSLAIAIVLIVTYCLSLVFSLKTHKDLYVGRAHEIAEVEDEGHAPWSKGKSLGILLLSTVFVAIISEFLVGSIENARSALGLTEVFVGVIVVAIVGNAAEHSSAILMAMKNKMDLALGIANGSSLQIALFVAPVLLFASYFIGEKGPMDLEFTIPEIAAVAIAVFLVHQISGDGESNWLEGVQLLSVYIILGILFFFLPEMHHQSGGVVPGGALPVGSPAHN